MKTVKINLYKGDARNVHNYSSMSIMGFRNPLKQELERKAKDRFKPFSLPRRNGVHVAGDILDLKRGEYAASLKTRFRYDIWERPSTDLSTLIGYSHLFLSCYSFTILPLSWRHPHRVAASTLFSIWFLAYYSKLLFRQDNFSLRFTIVSIDSIEPYEALLRNNSDKLWEYIEAIYGQAKVLDWFQTPLKREEVGFDAKIL